MPPDGAARRKAPTRGRSEPSRRSAWRHSATGCTSCRRDCGRCRRCEPGGDLAEHAVEKPDLVMLLDDAVVRVAMQDGEKSAELRRTIKVGAGGDVAADEPARVETEIEPEGVHQEMRARPLVTGDDDRPPIYFRPLQKAPLLPERDTVTTRVRSPLPAGHSNSICSGWVTSITGRVTPSMKPRTRMRRPFRLLGSRCAARHRRLASPAMRRLKLSRQSAPKWT